MASHILISGTGRSGTTLLVQIFTHLGFDTGYTPADTLEQVDGLSHAGLERSLFDLNLPHVAKSPWFADEVGEALACGLEVEAVIVPFRGLFEAAESRRHVYREAERMGKDPVSHPGSLWKVSDPGEQERALAVQFYKLLEPLIARGVPIVFLGFPRFVEDAGYFHDQLAPVFSRHGKTREAVADVHARLVNPALVHRFAPPLG